MENRIFRGSIIIFTNYCPYWLYNFNILLYEILNAQMIYFNQTNFFLIKEILPKLSVKIRKEEIIYNE